MDQTVLVQCVQGHDEVLGELDDGPGGEALSVVLVDDLPDVLLEQLHHKEGEPPVLQDGVAVDNVGLELQVGLEDESFSLYCSVIVGSMTETLESHHRSISDSYSLVHHATPSSANLDKKNFIVKIEREGYLST